MTGTRTRVLIADDEPDTRDLVAEYLDGEGYEVLQATNGLEALLQVKRMRPDGIVLDLRMPRLGGLEALKRIHAFDPAIVVVVVTGDGTPEIRQSALALGAAAMLDKPFHLPNLLAALPVARAAPLAGDPVPTAAAAAKPGAEVPAAAPAAERATGSVLVVDDDPTIRGLLEEILTMKGFAVRTASDGASAVREIARLSADVILLDIEMPGLSGVDALPTLRALAPRAAVIMVSGSSDVEVSRRALAHGAFDYVIKPVDFDYLTRSLETALAMREM